MKLLISVAKPQKDLCTRKRNTEVCFWSCCVSVACGDYALAETVSTICPVTPASFNLSSMPTMIEA